MTAVVWACADCGHGHVAHSLDGICWTKDCDCGETRDDVVAAAARAAERDRLRGQLTQGSELPELRLGEYGPAVWTVTVAEIDAVLDRRPAQPTQTEDVAL